VGKDERFDKMQVQCRLSASACASVRP